VRPRQCCGQSGRQPPSSLLRLLTSMSSPGVIGRAGAVANLCSAPSSALTSEQTLKIGSIKHGSKPRQFFLTSHTFSSPLLPGVYSHGDCDCR
jgi:hypothetical protein